MWGEGKVPEFQINEEFRLMVVFKPSEIIVESFLSIKTLTQKTAFLRHRKEDEMRVKNDKTKTQLQWLTYK